MTTTKLVKALKDQPKNVPVKVWVPGGADIGHYCDVVEARLDRGGVVELVLRREK